MDRRNAVAHVSHVRASGDARRKPLDREEAATDRLGVRLVRLGERPVRFELEIVGIDEARLERCSRGASAGLEAAEYALLERGEVGSVSRSNVESTGRVVGNDVRGRLLRA